MVDGITLAHPFNTSFDKVHYCTTDDEAAQVATGEMIKHLRAESTDLHKTALAAESSSGPLENSNAASVGGPQHIIVYTSTFYIGLNISLKDGTQIPFFARCVGITFYSYHWGNPKIGYLLAIPRILRHLPQFSRIQR